MHTAVSTMSSVPETQPPPFVPVLCFNPAHNTNRRTESGVPCRHPFWFLDIYFHTRPGSWGQRPGCEAALLFYCRFSNYILSLQGCFSSLQLQRWTYWASQTEILDKCYCWTESITMQKRCINTTHLLTALLHCMRKNGYETDDPLKLVQLTLHLKTLHSIFFKVVLDLKTFSTTWKMFMSLHNKDRLLIMKGNTL